MCEKYVKSILVQFEKDNLHVPFLKFIAIDSRIMSSMLFQFKCDYYSDYGNCFVFHEISYHQFRQLSIANTTLKALGQLKNID